VRNFVEKPDAATATELIRTGAAWSMGIVAGRISQFVDLYPRTVPGLMLDLKAIVEYWPDPCLACAELASLYSRHPKVDFSRDVLQRHPNRLQFLTAIPCGWSDVGTPERLANTLRSLRLPDGHTTSGEFNLASAFDRMSAMRSATFSTERDARVVRYEK
jgi:mannose-1-phosphate guanylyltransferase